jgi:hypothetical protein
LHATTRAARSAGRDVEIERDEAAAMVQLPALARNVNERKEDHMKRQSKASTSLLTVDRNLIAGIKKHLTKSEPITLNNHKYSAAELIQVLESRVEAHAPVALAKAAWLKAARAKEERLSATDVLVQAMKLYFLVRYGTSADVLADFGLVPKTRKAPTLAEKYAAASKAKATKTSKKTGAGPAAQTSTNGSAPAPAHVPSGQA